MQERFDKGNLMGTGFDFINVMDFTASEFPLVPFYSDCLLVCLLVCFCLLMMQDRIDKGNLMGTRFNFTNVMDFTASKLPLFPFYSDRLLAHLLARLHACKIDFLNACSLPLKYPGHRHIGDNMQCHGNNNSPCSEVDFFHMS